MEDAVAELRYLTQSDNRAEALGIVADDEPVDRSALESRLDASHRTVVRVVNSLEERGYLRQADRELRLTPFGAGIATRFDDALDRTAAAVEFETLLRNGPPVFRDLPIDALSGAELLVASSADPFSILDRVLSLRAESTYIREVAPAVQQESIDQLASRIRRGEEFDVETVISERASERASERIDYREGHETTIESDSVDIYVHPKPISFFVGVMDDTAAFGASKDGQPHALAVSTDPELRTAAESIFERYRDESTHKTTV
ncbi:Predicted transcriptional regulator, contains HTH domain [Haloplanus vescus]|uniref:Predicted transcriptional regulator, contains HTH domain n=1 Tax=Haloplanus vescus TaxID=555874 RepID=A0A1H3Y9U0_9EURY|nr:hypothetical protein [Haloplanus vescus]SEA07662.1 Predicted transcriptional regulator, contains HTH domain [Haloplanus vescus]